MKTIATWTVLTLFLCDHLLSQPYNDPIGISVWRIPEKNSVSESYLKVFGSVPFCSKNKIPITLSEPICNIKKSNGKPDTVQKVTFLIQPYYEHRILNSVGANENTLHLNGIGLPFIFTNYSKDKQYEYLVTAIVRSNFKEFSFNGKTFQIGLAIINRFRLSPKLRVSAGLYTNTEFDHNYFTPLVGIEYRFCDRLNFFSDIPSNGKLDYRVLNKLSMGIAYRSITNSYRVNKSGIDYIKIEDLHLTLYAEYYICDQIVVSIDGGLTSRRNKIVSNNTEAFSAVVKNGPVIRAGLYYRLPNDLW